MSNREIRENNILEILRRLGADPSVPVGFIGLVSIVGISTNVLEEILCAQQETNNKLDQLICTVVEIAHKQ